MFKKFVLLIKIHNDKTNTKIFIGLHNHPEQYTLFPVD